MFRSGGFWVYFPSPHLLRVVPRTGHRAVFCSADPHSAVRFAQLRSKPILCFGRFGRQHPASHFHFPLTSLPLLDIFKFWVKIEPNLTSIWAKLYFSTIETRGKCLTFYKIHFVLCLFTLKHIQIREALSLKQVGWNNFIISSPMSWFHNKLSDHN